MRMGFRKQPRGKTIEGGIMLMVTNSTIHWLVIKEEDRMCTSPQIISTYVMYYS